jgi:hypothetical protein
VDYQGNPLNREEKPAKQVEKVVTGEVVLKPKGIGYKFKTIFLGGDLKSAGKSVVADVIFPGLRRLLFDAIVNGSSETIFGDRYRQKRNVEYGTRVNYTPYNTTVNRAPLREPRERMGPPLPDQPRRYVQERAENRDVILARKEDAERVVEGMIDIISQYDTASLADLYELMGQPSTPIDFKWGWSYFTNVQIRQVREGWLIELPPLEVV